MLGLFFLLSLSTANDYVDFFHEIDSHSEVCTAFTIGKTVNDNEIWGMRINGNETNYRLPKIKLVGEIHGNEIRSRDILMHLIEFLCLQSEPHNVVATSDIYIIPSLNVDGHELRQRENAKDVDLNRNFPDSRFPARVQRPIQPETEAYMNFSTQEAFVLGMSFHTGDLVCCIPYNSGPRVYSRSPQPTEDDALFRALANKYVSRHPRMSSSTKFPGGIVNGAAWYVFYGGLADWDYAFRGCNSLTIEICRDCTNTGFFYWEENKESILSFLESANQNRVYGIVTNVNEVPLDNYKIDIKNMDNEHVNFVYTNLNGVFHKILLPGQYQLRLHNNNDRSVTEKNFTMTKQEHNVFLGNLIIH